MFLKLRNDGRGRRAGFCPRVKGFRELGSWVAARQMERGSLFNLLLLSTPPSLPAGVLRGPRRAGRLLREALRKLDSFPLTGCPGESARCGDWFLGIPELGTEGFGLAEKCCALHIL